MANTRKARQEDPNAETQAKVAAVTAPSAVNAPQSQAVEGGSPLTSGTGTAVKPGAMGEASNIYVTGPGTMSTPEALSGTPPTGYRPRGIPEWGDIKTAYEEGAAKINTGSGTPARPWGAEQATTDLGRLYKEKMDASRDRLAEKPPWTIKQVKQAEPEFVSAMKDKLWEKFQNLSETEKNSTFWQGVGQNAEYVAADMVRTMLHNSQVRDRWMTGEEAPTLGAAVKNQLQMSDTWRWLNWIQGNGERPASGSPVTPPSPTRAGLEAVRALRDKRGDE